MAHKLPAIQKDCLNESSQAKSNPEGATPSKWMELPQEFCWPLIFKDTNPKRNIDIFGLRNHCCYVFSPLQSQIDCGDMTRFQAPIKTAWGFF